MGFFNHTKCYNNGKGRVDMKEIQGYKAFNKDRTNRYGRVFLAGRVYQVNAKPKFGNKGIGFHFCRRLEDTLRYFPAMEEEIAIAQVTAIGDIVESSDEYYGYYEMFSTNRIRIERFLTRLEIIQMYLAKKRLPELRVIRFIQNFKLSPEEIVLFKVDYAENVNIQNVISYYQEGNKDVYNIEEIPKQRLKQ